MSWATTPYIPRFSTKFNSPGGFAPFTSGHPRAKVLPPKLLTAECDKFLRPPYAGNFTAPVVSRKPIIELAAPQTAFYSASKLLDIPSGYYSLPVYSVDVGIKKKKRVAVYQLHENNIVLSPTHHLVTTETGFTRISCTYERCTRSTKYP